MGNPHDDSHLPTPAQQSDPLDEAPTPEPLDDHGTTQSAEKHTARTSSGERTIYRDHPDEPPAEASRQARADASAIEPGVAREDGLEDEDHERSDDVAPKKVAD